MFGYSPNSRNAMDCIMVAITMTKLRCQPSVVSITYRVLRSEAAENLLLNGSTVSKWKMHCDWLIGLRQFKIAVVLGSFAIWDICRKLILNSNLAKSRLLITNFVNAQSFWCFAQSTAMLMSMGIHWSPVNSPHKGQRRGALMFPLICTWINGWVNNREAGDLRRHRAHYDVTIMQRACMSYIAQDHCITTKLHLEDNM